MILLATGLLILIAGRSPGLRGPAARLAAVICCALGLLMIPLLGLPALVMALTLGFKGVLISLVAQTVAMLVVLGLTTAVLKRSFLNIDMRK
jgi:hypothetical protein